MQGNNDPWYCITCSSSIFPFNCINNKRFASLFISQSEANNYSFGSNNSSVKSFTKTYQPSKPIADNFIHSKYFDIDEIQKLKILNKRKCLSLFHVNTCSLSKNFDELQQLLKILIKIAITETRIRKDVTITSNLSLNN